MEPTISLLPPTQLIQHELVEGPRLRRLARDIQRNGVQVPVAVALTSRGPFVLDGAHRSMAARLAGLEYIPCEIFSMADGAAIDGWTHVIDSPVAIAALHELIRVSSQFGGPVVATVSHQGVAHAVRAGADHPTAVAHQFHAIARRYAWSTYRRSEEPIRSAQMQLTWRMPQWDSLIELVAQCGVLPAGVSRFAPLLAAQRHAPAAMLHSQSA